MKKESMQTALLSAEIGKQIATIAARVSGWGSKDLDGLVQAVETATTDDRGAALKSYAADCLRV